MAVHAEGNGRRSAVDSMADPPVESTARAAFDEHRRVR
jgi:hypothetical protein